MSEVGAVGAVGAADALAAESIRVLRTNDRGTWTRPSPRLYPHQWSWDAAFIAIGWDGQHWTEHVTDRPGG